MFGKNKPFNRPTRKVCANCGNTYIVDDKYCRFCGVPQGEAKIIVEDFACIYGPPPMKRVHKCAKCGYSWETNQMIDDQKWCPECGGPAPAENNEEWM